MLNKIHTYIHYCPHFALIGSHSKTRATWHRAIIRVFILINALLVRGSAGGPWLWRHLLIFMARLWTLSIGVHVFTIYPITVYGKALLWHMVKAMKPIWQCKHHHCKTCLATTCVTIPRVTICKHTKQVVLLHRPLQAPEVDFLKVWMYVTISDMLLVNGLRYTWSKTAWIKCMNGHFMPKSMTVFIQCIVASNQLYKGFMLISLLIRMGADHM